jgi:hypothetical protein
LSNETIKRVDAFAHSLCGCNYQVWIDFRHFLYEKDGDFLIQDLKKAYSERDDLYGEIEKTSLDEAIKKIEEYLRLESTYGWNLASSSNKKLIENRFSKFFGFLSEKINLNNVSIVYKHIPEDSGSFFVDYIIWGFCFIFLYSNKKEGLLGGGCASD